jgi:hypothetical protein
MSTIPEGNQNPDILVEGARLPEGDDGMVIDDQCVHLY